MHVHRRARLVFHRLGHERRIHLVTQRSLAHRALEQEHAVRELERIAVHEVDFHLRRADFVNQRVDFQLLNVAVLVDVFEQRIEFVDRFDRVRLTARLRTPGPADRRLQRQIRVLVHVDQVELEFRRDNRLPARALYSSST